jgi:hypothetical protein
VGGEKESAHMAYLQMRSVKLVWNMQQSYQSYKEDRHDVEDYSRLPGLFLFLKFIVFH